MYKYRIMDNGDTKCVLPREHYDLASNPSQGMFALLCVVALWQVSYQQYTDWLRAGRQEFDSLRG
jgi:hypothetical protein